MERATWSAQTVVGSRHRTRFFTPSEAEAGALPCPPSPTLTTTLPYPTQPHKHTARKPQSGRLELGGGGAVQYGSCSSKERFPPRWTSKRDSCSQKAPRGRLAQPCHLTCSMDVTVSTESSCNRSRACSGLRLYSGSGQTGEEDGGQQ